MVHRGCWKKLSGCLAVAVLVVSTKPVAASDYTFEIPQLVGNYLGDITAIPTIDVVVDLGIDFAQIESASLQLTGTQTLGLMGDLNSSYTFSLPAEIIGRFEGPDAYSDVFIDELLPDDSGAFDFDETFRVGPFASGPPDFAPWLDGIAEFEFLVTPPPTLAIYYLIEMPSVTISSAALVIQGQPNLDNFILPGDFDRDGDVDSSDLAMWQDGYGAPEHGAMTGRDFLEWQRQYGSGMRVAESIAVPEPVAGVLLKVSLALAISAARRDGRLDPKRPVVFLRSRKSVDTLALSRTLSVESLIDCH